MQFWTIRIINLYANEFHYAIVDYTNQFADWCPTKMKIRNNTGPVKEET